MESQETLKKYFGSYMVNIRGRSESTAKHYLDALNNISRHLREGGLVEDSIYEITDLDELYAVKDFLLSSEAFIQQNKRGNQMYSAGLNNYLRFAEGEGLEKIGKDKVTALDTEVPVQKKKEAKHYIWNRSNIIRRQSIQMADYKCEMDESHETFIVANTNHAYMEGHHAIPISKQDLFPHNSLDIYANVVCMCPLCHRKIHYANDYDKKEILLKIYANRGERLNKSGIRLSKDEFTDIILK